VYLGFPFQKDRTGWIYTQDLRKALRELDSSVTDGFKTALEAVFRGRHLQPQTLEYPFWPPFTGTRTCLFVSHGRVFRGRAGCHLRCDSWHRLSAWTHPPLCILGTFAQLIKRLPCEQLVPLELYISAVPFIVQTRFGLSCIASEESLRSSQNSSDATAFPPRLSR